MPAVDGLLQASDVLCFMADGLLLLGAAATGEAVHDGRNRRTLATAIQEKQCIAKRSLPNDSSGSQALDQSESRTLIGTLSEKMSHVKSFWTEQIIQVSGERRCITTVVSGDEEFGCSYIETKQPSGKGPKVESKFLSDGSTCQSLPFGNAPDMRSTAYLSGCL